MDQTPVNLAIGGSTATGHLETSHSFGFNKFRVYRLRLLERLILDTALLDHGQHYPPENLQCKSFLEIQSREQYACPQLWGPVHHALQPWV
jgi:hypothetical protein